MEGASGAAARIGDGIEVAVTELSFDELFEIEHRALFRALYLITGDVQEAEELMQDAFLRSAGTRSDRDQDVDLELRHRRFEDAT